ncbi:DUF108 domain-containing protein [Halorubrum sp. CBA1125]|uniref:aspartate dehydrogenase domain-containing protein n=1 Tax=Halorubrum sp. CBA1125 TaxID=2668072 RepID=UPI0012E7787A|nr:aspartate dehydrogenase domain-containing protein [Halorubrum sp. CBA1125]MUW13676.1 DUF108 domain-containing protein [Halorubrum sp. CBA1125]
MPSPKAIGLIGFGRIGQYLADRIAEDPHTTLRFVCVRDPASVSESTSVSDSNVAVVPDPGDLTDRDVDLIVEAAHADVLAAHGADLLEVSDVLALSTTVFADREVEAELSEACDAGGTRLFVPHGAVLGTDGLQDGRPSLESVTITTRKNPDNIDFERADISSADVDAETVLFDGSTRDICGKFPRNVNSHATIAIAGIGFDRTTSKLIADPAASEATHEIVAEGPGTRLEITRVSSIEGVTGSYTLDSIWGTVSRIPDHTPGTTVV